MPVAVVIPGVFIGMTLALWTLKCASLVVFQNKIIYMPSLPPYARGEKLEDYTAMCGKVKWRADTIRSSDGHRLAVAVGSIGHDSSNATQASKPGIVILYFQGNGSSTPPRLPSLSRTLTTIHTTTSQPITLCALSYRGYWTSTGSPSQDGIERDATSFLSWAATTYPSTPIILWGQSIGAGIASTALAAHLTDPSPTSIDMDSYHDQRARTPDQDQRIKALILETPFVNIRGMLTALYPQKWLPYRYLWPFLRSHWDSCLALRSIAASGKTVPPMLLLAAEKDEVVPPGDAAELEELCKGLGLGVERREVRGALHHQAAEKVEGRRWIAEFIQSALGEKMEGKRKDKKRETR
ncbi:Hypothetical protein D9617_1g079610 [Elsinoe fawcettii]|nr:Hypothetical protein D9617_1g079610 [Elsinoe fawcettii]